MDFVCKLYGNTYAVHVTVALVGVATLNLALPAPLAPGKKTSGRQIDGEKGREMRHAVSRESRGSREENVSGAKLKTS